MSGCERGSCSPQNTEIKDPRASLDSWSPGLRAVAALSKTVCPSSTSALLPRPQLTRGSTQAFSEQEKSTGRVLVKGVTVIQGGNPHSAGLPETAPWTKDTAQSKYTVSLPSR